MVMCFSPQCKHYNERHTCKFFRFPKNERERKRWTNLIRRQDRCPNDNSRICSCHFIDGLRENGPTLFKHNVEKRFQFSSPEKRTKTRKTKVMPPSHQATCNTDETAAVSEGVSNLCEVNMSASTSTVLTDAENYFLQKEVTELTAKNKREVAFSFEHICDTDDLVALYTGLPNKDIFMVLFNLLNKVERNYYLNWHVEKITPVNQLLLTLYKLRLNTPHKDVAQRFNCCTATVTNVFMTWLHLMHEIIFQKLMASVPSRAKNEACLPSCFSMFPNTRMVIDCTEVFCEIPSSMLKQKETYSSYKHRNTVKGLVGIAPNGVITYVTNLYPGSVSDKKIVQHSGILKVFEAGDLILADKGFLILDILPPGVSLNIPPFLLLPQFTEDQVIQTRNIARARIHVERAIRRIKEYSILSLIPQNLLPMADKIWQVCAALTNFQSPLIKEVYEN